MLRSLGNQCVPRDCFINIQKYISWNNWSVLDLNKNVSSLQCLRHALAVLIEREMKELITNTFHINALLR